MTTVEVVPTCDTAIEKDDNLTHLICRYDIPLKALSPIPRCVRFVVEICTATVSESWAQFVWCADTWREGDQQHVPERGNLVAACHM